MTKPSYATIPPVPEGLPETGSATRRWVGEQTAACESRGMGEAVSSGAEKGWHVGEIGGAGLAVAGVAGMFILPAAGMAVGAGVAVGAAVAAAGAALGWVSGGEELSARKAASAQAESVQLVCLREVGERLRTRREAAAPSEPGASKGLGM